MNAFNIVKDFEKTVAEYAGSKYAVAVDSCSNALLLCCLYHKVDIVTMPCRTYFSVANAIIHAGGRLHLIEQSWKGAYVLSPYPIVDAARRFHKGMYKLYNDYDMCLSFHGKKILNLGRGGMILTNDKKAVDWYKAARFDGRNEGVPTNKDQLKLVGHHFYMTPEMAAEGLVHMSFVDDHNRDLVDDDPDLREQEVYKPYIVEDNPRYSP